MWVTLHYHQLPIVFQFVWLILVLAAFYDDITVYRQQVGIVLLSITAATALVGIGILIGRRKRVQKAYTEDILSKNDN
jgi:NADH:ubiquinone oxidoreductase subunit K